MYRLNVMPFFEMESNRSLSFVSGYRAVGCWRQGGLSPLAVGANKWATTGERFPTLKSRPHRTTICVMDNYRIAHESLLQDTKRLTWFIHSFHTHYSSSLAPVIATLFSHLPVVSVDWPRKTCPQPNPRKSKSPEVLRWSRIVPLVSGVPRSKIDSPTKSGYGSITPKLTRVIIVAMEVRIKSTIVFIWLT
jgi:hypothetical protein